MSERIHTIYFILQHTSEYEHGVTCARLTYICTECIENTEFNSETP